MAPRRCRPARYRHFDPDAEDGPVLDTHDVQLPSDARNLPKATVRYRWRFAHGCCPTLALAL
jgi:hypothetical protein